MTVTITPMAGSYANGTPNDGPEVQTDFNACQANFTNIKTKLDTVLAGNLEDARTLTLDNTYAGSTPGDATFAVERGTLTNTALRYEDATNDQWEATNNGTTYFPLLPPGHRSGCKVEYSTAARVTIATGSWANSTNKDLITPAVTLTLDLTVAGANGLDTGAEASGTWYYVYLIEKSSDGTVAGVLSVTNESASGSITFPPGYDLKRQLPIAIRNDGSSNIIPFRVTGWPFEPLINYRVNFTDLAGPTQGTTSVVSGGTADNTFRAAGCSSYVPPISRCALIHAVVVGATANGSTYIRQTGSGLTVGTELRALVAENEFPMLRYPQELDTSQQLDYKIVHAAHDLYVDIMGYYVTQL